MIGDTACEDDYKHAVGSFRGWGFETGVVLLSQKYKQDERGVLVFCDLCLLLPSLSISLPLFLLMCAFCFFLSLLLSLSLIPDQTSLPLSHSRSNLSSSSLSLIQKISHAHYRGGQTNVVTSPRLFRILKYTR